MAPYIPREHYCDRPQMPENKRAHIIAGVSGMQAVLLGMPGLEPTLDGHLVHAGRKPLFCSDIPEKGSAAFIGDGFWAGNPPSI